MARKSSKKFDDIFADEYQYNDKINSFENQTDLDYDDLDDGNSLNSAEASTSFSFDNEDDENNDEFTNPSENDDISDLDDEDNDEDSESVSKMKSTDDMDEDGDEDSKANDNDIDPTKFGLKPCKPKNIYCNNAELIEEIRKYQQDGVATNKLGELIIKIALHMTTMVRFWRYPHHLKEELAQNAIYRMLLSVPKFNLKNDKANAFGYFSMISYRDMLHTLKRHFKQNKVTEILTEAYISKLAEHPNDERLGMLRHTLEKSEEYNNFMKNKGNQEKEVDTFALSRAEQEKRYKASLKKNKKENKSK